MFRMIFVGLGSFGLWAAFLATGLLQSSAFSVASLHLSWACFISGLVGLIAWLKL